METSWIEQGWCRKSVNHNVGSIKHILRWGDEQELVPGSVCQQLRASRRAHRWHPHQLSHAAATEQRKEFGLEAARVMLGHQSAAVTELCADDYRYKLGLARVSNADAVPGPADLRRILWSGRRFEGEVKGFDGRQSIEQAWFQRMIERFGGLYVPARSVDDVWQAIGGYLREPPRPPQAA